MSRSLNSLLIAAGAVALLAAGGLAGGFGAAAAGLDAAEADGQDQQVDTQVRRRVVTRHRGWQADEDYGRIVTRLNRLIERAEQRAATADNPEEAAKYQQLVQTRQARLDQVESRRVRVNRVAEEPAGGESAGDDSGGTSREPRQDPNTVFYGPLAPSSEPEPQPEPEVDFPVLQPGPGWSGPTPQPPAVGSPDMAGYDAKAIARWDVVPFQTFEGEFHIGVVAFHMNGIDRVEFSVNDGPWEPVYEMKLNPRTGVWEYTATLDSEVFHVEQVEVRAVVYPVAGEARVLGGEISVAAHGNHSLILNANTGAEWPRTVVYVAPDGSDEEGTGSAEQPYANIGWAIAQASSRNGSADGISVRCLPGRYSFSTVGVGGHRNTVSHWVTIEPATDVARSDVIIDASAIGGVRANRVHLRNLTIEGSVRLVAHHLWLDACEVAGLDPREDYKILSSAWSPGGIYATDVVAHNSRNTIRGATLTRNCHIYDVSGSPFGGSPLTLNCTVDNYLHAGHHGDVWHWLTGTATDRNIIAFNVTAKQFTTQGLFAEVHNGDVLDNVALVNVHISGDGGADYYGNWWEPTTNHLLMWHVSLPDGLMRWAQSSYGTALRNISIIGSVWRAFAFQNPEDWPNTRIEHNHFTNLGIYGAYAAGEDVTTGEPKYLDQDNLDYRPSALSPLRHRVEDRLVPCLIDGSPRGDEASALGPWAAAGGAGLE